MCKFAIGDEVMDPASNLSGHVIGIAEPPFQGLPVQVRVVLSNGTTAYYPEDSLSKSFSIDNVYDLCRHRCFSSYEEYMTVNTLFKIDNVNNNTISTLRASKTQFKAYQFKPLLKFFSSPEKRILIADEVGLGKTIEAGHIILELKARKEFRHALIVCPKSLQEKWREEMCERFGVSFEIYSSADDLIRAYDSNHDVHAIITYERIRYKKPKINGQPEERNDENRRPFRVVDFIVERNLRHSIVICDESHRLRNEETQSYAGAEKLLALADSVVFLTATPVMIREENLYNQMHLLLPEKYFNSQVFANRMAEGKPFVFALTRLCHNESLSSVWTGLQGSIILKRVFIDTSYGPVEINKEVSVDEAFSGDPVYERLKKNFPKGETSDIRASIMFDLAKMSAIENEFTRTTKRQVVNQIGKVNVRRPHRISVDLDKVERKEFDKILCDYSESSGENLGLVQIKRMASSSVFGYLNTDEDLEHGIDRFAECRDAKVEALARSILAPSQENGHRTIKKVIVFAVFKRTLKYLKIRLEKLGVRCAIIDGTVKYRHAVIDNFRFNDATRVLLSSEVGSEGLDMQFCDTVVNYDLPWNPMVVEQRIGRIDRIGQCAETIHIYNLVVTNSIAETIYDRLLERIGIFQGTIGDLEPILGDSYTLDGQKTTIGEAQNKLETDYYEGRKTREEVENEIKLIDQAIASERLTLTEIMKGIADKTVSDDSYYAEQIALIQDRKAYVTGTELRCLLTRVLAIPETGCSQCILSQTDKENVWLLQLPHQGDGKDCLVRFLRLNRPAMEASDLRAFDDFIASIENETELRLTFSQSTANDNRDVVFVNNYSPLVQACNAYRTKSGIETHKVFCCALKPDESIYAGERYYLVCYRLTVNRNDAGEKTSVRELLPVLFDIKKRCVVLDERKTTHILSLVQDEGLATELPPQSDCADDVVGMLQPLATQFAQEAVSAKKKKLEEQDNVDRMRWRKQTNEYYEEVEKFYKGQIEECERRLNQAVSSDEKKKIRNQIAGFRGTLTSKQRDRDVKIERLSSIVSLSIERTEISVCHITILGEE